MATLVNSKPDLVVFIFLSYCVSIVEAQALSCTTEILIAVFVLLASLLLIGIIIFAIWYFCCFKKGKQNSNNDIENQEGKFGVVSNDGTVHCPYCERNFPIRTAGNNVDIGISNLSFDPGSKEMAVDVPNNNLQRPQQKIPYIVGPKMDTEINRGKDGSIGLMIAHEKRFPIPSMFVREVVPNGPAAKAGVLEYGDEIVGINGKSLEGMTHTESKSLLHAEPGDTKPVKLTVVKNSLQTKAQMRANMSSVDVNRPSTSRDAVIDMPDADISAGAPKGRKKSGLNCCGSPKTKGESEYGYELEPVGEPRRLEISGKSGGNAGIQGPKSHVINMGGGMSNDGFDAPDASLGGASGGVNVKGPRVGTSGVSDPKGKVPYLVGPVVDTSIRKGDNGSLDVLIAKETDFPSPAMFIRKVYNPTVKIKEGDEIVGINGVPIKGKSYEESMTMLRNAPGKKIKVGVVKNSHNIKANMKYNRDGTTPPNLAVSPPKAKSGVNCCGSPKTQGEMNYAYEADGQEPKGRISGKGNVDGTRTGYSGPNAPKKNKGAKLNCCTSPKTSDDIDMDYGLPSGSVKPPSVRGDEDTPDVQVHGPGFKGPKGKVSGPKAPSFAADIDGPDVELGRPKFKGPEKDIALRSGFDGPSFNGDIDGPDMNIKGPGFKGPKKNLSGGLNGPDIDGPSFNGGIDGPDVNVKGPGLRGPKGKLSDELNGPDIDGPSFNGDIDSPDVNVKGPGFKVPKGKLSGGLDGPDADIDVPGAKIKGPGSKGPRGNLSGKGGINGPDISGPSFDGDINGPDANVRGPGFKRPKGNLSGDLNGTDIDGDVNGPDINIKGPKGPHMDADINSPDINGPSIRGPKKPKLKGPGLKCCGSSKGMDDSDGEYELPSGSARIKGPKGKADIKGPDYHAEGPSISGDIDTPDTRYQGPGFKGPKGKISGKADFDGPDVDVRRPKGKLSGKSPDAHIDIDGPSVNGSKKAKVKKPKLKWCGSKTGANDSDGEYELPSASAGMKVDEPDINTRGTSVDVDVNRPDMSIQGPGLKGPKGSHGLKGPDFDIERPSFGGDIDGHDLKFKGPNVKGPDFENPDIENPDFDADIDGPDGKVKKPGFKGPSWKFKKPNLDLPDWKLKKPGFKGPDFDGPSVEGDFDGPDGNVNKPGLDGPDIKGPSFDGDVDGPDLKVKGPHIEGPDMEGPDFDGDMDGPDGKVKKPGFKGPNWKLKKPDLSLPDWKLKKPGFKGPDYDGPSVEGDFDGPDVNVKKPGFDGPDIKGPSFDGDVDGPDLKVRGPNIDGPDMEGPDFDADIDGPDGKVKKPGFKGPNWKFKKPDLSLPDWKLKKPGFKGPDFDGPSVEGDFDGPDVNVKKPGFDGPDIKGPSFDGDVDGPDLKVRGPHIDGPDMEGPDFDADIKGPSLRNIDGPDFDGPYFEGDIDGPNVKRKSPGLRGPSWKFKKPDVSLPDWKLKKPDFNGPDLNGPSFKGDIDGTDFNVRTADFDGPGIEITSFKEPRLDGSSMGGHVEGGDVNIATPNTKELSLGDRLGGPDLNVNTPGFSTPKSNVDVDLPEFDSSGPSFDGNYDKSVEVRGPKFGMPKGSFNLMGGMPNFGDDIVEEVDAGVVESSIGGPDGDLVFSEDEHGNLVFPKPKVKAPTAKVFGVSEKPVRWSASLERDQVPGFKASGSAENSSQSSSSSSSEDEKDKSESKKKESKPRVKRKDKKSSSSSSSSSEDEGEGKSKGGGFGIKLPGWKKNVRRSSSSSSSSDTKTSPSKKDPVKRKDSSSSSSSASPKSYDLTPKEKGKSKQHKEGHATSSSSSSESDSELPTSFKIKPEVEKIEMAENIEVESQPDFPSFESETKVTSPKSPKSPVMKLSTSHVFPDVSDGSVSVKLVPNKEGSFSTDSQKDPTSPTYRASHSPGKGDSKLWDIVQGYIDTDDVINDDGTTVPRKAKEEPAIPTYTSSLERTPKISKEERREKTRSLPPRVSPRNFSVEIDDSIDDPWAKHYLGDRRGTGQSLSKSSSRSNSRPSSGDRQTVSPSMVFSKVPHVKSPLDEAERDPITGLRISPRGKPNPKDSRRISLKELEGAPTKRLHDNMFQLSKEKSKPTERERQRESRKYLWDLGPSEQSRGQVETKPRSRSSPPSANRGAMSPVRVDISADTRREEFRARPNTSRRSYELSKSQPSLSLTTEGGGEPTRLTLKERKALFEKSNF